MGDFLDYLVSTTWLAVSVFIFMLFFIVGIWFYRPFKNMIFNRIIHVAFSISGFLFLMYMILGSSGYAVNFIRGITNGKQICLVEEHYQSDGDAGGSDVWRLYVLDLETGKKVYKMMVDSPEILYVSEKSVVFFEWNYAVEYDLIQGNKTREWSYEKGFEKFPELRVGIQDINRHSESTSNSAYLTITAKDGHKYCFDFATEQLFETDYLNTPDSSRYTYDDDGVYYKQIGDYSNLFSYGFKDKTGEIEQLVYSKYPAEDLLFDGEFLYPSVVGLNPKSGYFLVKHFTTLEKNNAVLTAINFDMTVKWRVEQFELKVIDEYSVNPEIGQCISVNNNYVVTYGGFVVYLNGETGEVIWQSRM